MPRSTNVSKPASFPYLVHKENVMIADSAEQWVAALRSLFEDGTKRERIAENASRIASEYYNWHRFVGEVTAVYEDVLRGRTRVGGDTMPQ